MGSGLGISLDPVGNRFGKKIRSEIADIEKTPFDPGRSGRMRDQRRDRSEAEKEKLEAEADSYSLIQFQRGKEKRAKGKRSTILTGPQGVR